MWFTDIAAVENPGREELQLFIQDARHFLLFILEDTQNFGFLWQHDPSLHSLAMDTLKYDVIQGASMELEKAILQTDSACLSSYGLEGRPLRFRFLVLNSIANQWKSTRRDFSVRMWLRQVVAAINTILDPLIDAADGAGRLLKEYKDALAAMA
jgi:hypothetical protein